MRDSKLTLAEVSKYAPGFTDAVIVGDAKQPGDDFVDVNHTYVWYRALAQVTAPRSILEMGVRYGYSGIAMLKGAQSAGIFNSDYVGIDGEVDGVLSNEIARRHLQVVNPRRGSVLIVKANTKDILNEPKSTLDLIRPAAFFDLVHIDGDHSPEGIITEFKLADYWVKPDGIIVVDDMDTPHVCTATVSWCRDHKKEFIIMPTVHGTAVIDMKYGG